MGKILAVDGTNVVMRYAFALLGAQVDTSSAPDILRVVEAVERAIRDAAVVIGSNRALIALDAPGSWRKEVEPTYKANRAQNAGTGDWSARLGAHLAAQDWTCLSVPGFEADDVLATAATRAVEHGHDVAILSGDSDLLALAGDRVEVWQFGKKGEPRYVRRSVEWISKHYGIRSVAQLPLYKALVGEPGDNIPGVRGVGPVKARAILKGYPTAEEISGTGIVVRREFEESLRLVRLREDVPLPGIRATRLVKAEA